MHRHYRNQQKAEYCAILVLDQRTPFLPAPASVPLPTELNPLLDNKFARHSTYSAATATPLESLPALLPAQFPQWRSAFSLRPLRISAYSALRRILTQRTQRYAENRREVYCLTHVSSKLCPFHFSSLIFAVSSRTKHASPKNLYSKKQSGLVGYSLISLE